MFSSKAIDIVKTLSPEEMKEFGQFIRSPYFNSNKNLIKLFDVVRGGREKGVTEEFLYGKVFPGKAYNYGIFKNLLSELYVQVCDYLAVKRLRQMRGDRNTYLIKELVDRKLVKHADRWISTTKEFFKEKNMSIEDLHTDFLMEEYSSFSNYARDQRWLHNLSKKEDPLLMSKKFAVYFLARFISQYLFITHSMFQLKREIKLKPMQDIINDTYSFLRENLDEESPIIEVLYNIFKMRTESLNTDWYFRLKKILLNNIDNISSQVARNGFIYLSNYCEDRVEKGDDDFIAELFNLQKIYFQSDIPIRFLGGVNPDTYEKIVVHGLALGEGDYVEEFIEKNSNLLPETAWNSSYYYSMACLQFYKRNYDEVISLISKIEGSFLLTEFATKDLLLMTYYELGEWERFYSLTTSYKPFTMNHSKLHQEMKKSYLGFIKNIHSLAKIKEKIGVNKNGLDVKLNKLLKDFKKEPSVSRVWLSQKAEELKKELGK
jgi:hypothetical protein